MTSDKAGISIRTVAAWQHLRPAALAVAKGACLGLLLAGLASHPAFPADNVQHLSRLNREDAALSPATEPSSALALAHQLKRANFEREIASGNARQVADWVVDSKDNHGLPFIIIDKTDAKAFIFKADGLLSGTAPVLLGLAHGDDSVPGIGDRKLSSIRPDERTTPAGRFVAALGRNLHGDEILWIDYDAAISLHRVITSKPEEHRLQRLATPTPLDNHISYGCINVPVKFYDELVHPAFAGTNGIVYVLPETRSIEKVFGSYNVD